MLVTTDNGITFTGANLSNPIPSGQLIQPVGSANGLTSQLGQSLGTLYSPERDAPFYTRWEMAVQHDFARRLGGGLDLHGIAGHKPAGRPAGEQHPDGVPVDVAVA